MSERLGFNEMRCVKCQQVYNLAYRHECSTLISKNQWMLKSGQLLRKIDYEKAFNDLWVEYEGASKTLLNMAETALNNPVVPKEITPEERDQLDKAIELLEACSEDLFIEGNDKPLEEAVDKFLNKVRPKCCGACEDCTDLPASLKKQAD